MNEERLFAATGLYVPLEEARRRHDAALPPLPGSAIAGRGLDALETSVDGRIFRRNAPGEVRHQPPAHHDPLTLAASGPDNRYALGRRDVVAALELPVQQMHLEIALSL